MVLSCGLLGVLTLVLYCRRDNQWKLTDFGVSTQATSKNAITTIYSRGTASYRAPELLGEEPSYTNKVDLFALGCVLHELATGKVAFSEDWAIRQYDQQNENMVISIPPMPRFLEHHISENILHLLRRRGSERPRAFKICQVFLSYCQVLSLSLAPKLVNALSHPTYEEWTQLLDDSPSEKDFLYHLASVYENHNEPGIGNSLLEELLFNEAKQRGEVLTEIELKFRLAEMHFLRGNYSAAAHEFEVVTNSEPQSFSAWQSLCRVHVTWNGVDRAIEFCNEIISRRPLSLFPGMQLCGILATKGDYKGAIQRYMDLADCESSLTQKYPSSNLSFENMGVMDNMYAQSLIHV